MRTNQGDKVKIKPARNWGHQQAFGLTGTAKSLLQV